MIITQMTTNKGREDYTLEDGDYYINFDKVKIYKEYIMIFDENTCTAIIKGEKRKQFEIEWAKHAK